MNGGTDYFTVYVQVTRKVSMMIGESGKTKIRSLMASDGSFWQVYKRFSNSSTNLSSFRSREAWESATTAYAEFMDKAHKRGVRGAPTRAEVEEMFLLEEVQGS